MAYAYKRRITIDHTKCGSGNSTDFPLCFAGTFTWLKTAANGGDLANASGYDLNFYSDEALTTPLKYERELHVLTTGQVVLWVKIPTLSSSTDTVIYVAYGDAGVTTDQSDKTNVWKTGFKGVYHLGEARSTSAGAYKDSTSNANNGTLTDSDSDCVSASVKLGNGMDFGGDGTDRIAVDDAASLDITGDFTITGWVRTNSTPGSGTFYGVLGKGTSSVPHNYIVIVDNGYVSSGLGLAVAIYNSGGSVVMAKVTISANTLYFFTMQWVAATGVVSIAVNNGTPTASSASGYTANSNAAKLVLGNWSDTDGSSALDGLLDEVRIHSGALDANWLTSQYNNENSPSTFYSIVPIYSGTVAVTIDAVTCSATGTYEAPGGDTYNGSADVAVGAVACAATGSMTIGGTVAATLAEVICSATGSMSISGTAAIVVGNSTCAGTGSLALSGTVSATVGSVGCSASGNLSISSTATATIDEVTCAAMGTVAISGTSAITLDPVVCAAIGNLAVSGTVDATLDQVICAATGTHVEAGSYSGSVDATLGAVTCEAIGGLSISGACAAIVSPIECAATGALSIDGTCDVVVDPVTCSAIGALSVSGACVAEVGAVVCNASGILDISGTCDVLLGAVVCAATGTHVDPDVYSGTVAATLNPISCVGVGTLHIDGICASTLGAVICNAVGAYEAVVAARLDMLMPERRVYEKTDQRTRTIFRSHRRNWASN